MMMASTESNSAVLLDHLLEGLADCSGCAGIRVKGITLDSRQVSQGDLFLACHGANTSGVNFTRDAINAGAVAVVAEQEGPVNTFIKEVPVIAMSDLRAKAGIIAGRFYGHPSEKINVIGVTGTNGKTSITYFIAQALSGILNHSVGMIGTLGTGLFPRMRPGINTTPDPVTIQRTMSELLDSGVQTIVMEVTSVGLDQERVAGVDFNTGIFTNLSIDHLDYHGDIDTYANVKKRLFTSHVLKHALINIDDEFGKKLIDEVKSNVDSMGYGLVQSSGGTGVMDYETILASVEELDEGMSLKINSPWGEGQLDVAITGKYNAYNLLASLAGMCQIGITFKDALTGLSAVTQVPGRLEKFHRGDTPEIYVDYAHTPDALEKVLAFLKLRSKGKLVCVFGCGGNRDTTKRAMMGTIAESYADTVVLTNDNPRNEDPGAIIEDILAGIREKDSVQVELDRGKAISRVISNADSGDTILIAGKGHEAYQEIAGKRIPFSDRQLVRNLLEEIA